MVAPLSGLLLVDKPAGLTSHDVVLRARRALGTARIGHSGTLDPMATGLLILLVGPATKSQGAFQKLPKTYTGVALLGVETETGDMEGRVLAERPVPPLELREIGTRMAALTGKLDLPAPAFSAVKHKGKPLYHYARLGIAVEAKPRVQEVFSWRLDGLTSPELAFTIECASGTYVRSVVEAFGRTVGCGAALKTLRRESVGGFRVSDAIACQDMERAPREELAERLLDPGGAGRA